MQRDNLELEKQQANEELAVLLTELVIKPIDKRFNEQLEQNLLEFNTALEKYLDGKFFAVAKAEAINTAFLDLDDSLERLRSDILGPIEGLYDNIATQSKLVRGTALKSQAELQSLLERLGAAARDTERKADLVFAELSVRLVRYTEEIRLRISDSEQQQIERASYYRTALNELAELVTARSQQTNSLAAMLNKRISASLEKSTQSASCLENMQELMAQQQTLMAAQRHDIHCLQRLLRRACWSGVSLGVLLLGAIGYVAWLGWTASLFS